MDNRKLQIINDMIDLLDPEEYHAFMMQVIERLRARIEGLQAVEHGIAAIDLEPIRSSQ